MLPDKGGNLQIRTKFQIENIQRQNLNPIMAHQALPINPYIRRLGSDGKVKQD